MGAGSGFWINTEASLGCALRPHVNRFGYDRRSCLAAAAGAFSAPAWAG